MKTVCPMCSAPCDEWWNELEDVNVYAFDDVEARIEGMKECVEIALKTNGSPIKSGGNENIGVGYGLGFSKALELSIEAIEIRIKELEA